MSIIYLGLMIIVYITMILLKRTEKKENIIKALGIGALIILCYNIFITYFFSLIHIKSTLTNLSIAILIVETILIYNIIKSRSIQKYYFRKRDLLFCIILLILVILFAYIRFDFLCQINYSITDGVTHFHCAEEFYKNSEILPKDSWYLFNFSSVMTGAYVNVGILFKCFSSFVSAIDHYIIYEIFDLSILYLSGVLFYILLSKNENKEKDKITNKDILAYIFTLIYLLGYQLNTTLSGFQYLALGLAIILGIIIMYQEKETIPIYMIITIFLLNFGIFFSYLYFIPVLFGTMLLLQIIKKKKNIFKLSNLMEIGIELFIPALCGLIFFIIIPIIKGSGAAISGIRIDGPSSEYHLYNIIIFIPFIIYYLTKSIKNKKIDFVSLLTIIETIFAIVMYIGKKVDIISNYYYGKTFYLLWILSIYITYNVIIEMIKKGKIYKTIAYVFVTIYILGIISVCITKNSLFIWNIYKENYIEITEAVPSLTKEEINILKYVNQNYKDKYKSLNYSSNLNGMWTGSLLDNNLMYAFSQHLLFDTYEEWIENEESELFIVFKRYGDIERVDTTKDDIVLDNDVALLLLKKK